MRQTGQGSLLSESSLQPYIKLNPKNIYSSFFINTIYNILFLLKLSEEDSYSLV